MYAILLSCFRFYLISRTLSQSSSFSLSWCSKAVASSRIFREAPRGKPKPYSFILFAEWKDTRSQDSNLWRSSSEEEAAASSSATDWQQSLASKQDGTFWTTFESSQEEEDTTSASLPGDVNPSSATAFIDDSEEWLNTLAQLSAEETEFNRQENERAEAARKMAEWGFDAETISNSLGVATDLSREVLDDVQGMEVYRQESYLDDVDLEVVESHTTVEIDPETNEPVRTQMVYVDEHTCIGCTNCAMIAQSTFFMHSEHGRARVFQQWGDDDETIQVAIETCPVDCIHYVPYDELQKLEIERREQNINFKARLVSQAENGNSLSHRVGGGAFTAPQKISGNMAARCNNCPSRGCYDCPMYGVGKNPEFEKKEKARKARLAKRKLQEQRERDQKRAEL